MSDEGQQPAAGRRQVLTSLIEKFLQGECTEEEEQRLQKWYASYEPKEDFTASLNETEKQVLRVDMLQAVLARKAGHTRRGRSVIPRRSATGRWLIAAAASVILLFTVFAVYRFIEGDTVAYHTAYGEIKTITLPDQSAVTLNGNSRLRYAKSWSNRRPREVWLEGEAFFSVTHQANDRRFLVHTGDSLQVEVLGTTFNVNQRNAGTSIALESGKVKLHIEAGSAQAREVPMEPGEVVKFERDRSGYTKKKEDNLDRYYSWKQQRLMLRETHLKELLPLLRDTYGLEVQVTHDSLLFRSASGSMPLSQDTDQLLDNTAALFELTLDRQGPYILLGPAP